LNAGENLLEGLDMRALGYECNKHVAGAAVRPLTSSCASAG